MERPAASSLTNGDQIATVEVGTVDPERVNLLGRVARRDVASGRRVPGPSRVDIDDAAIWADGPVLDLDSQQAMAQVEGCVVGPVLDGGEQHRDTCLNGMEYEAGLSDISFVVGIMNLAHEHMFVRKSA